ncbi:MAG: hypothetical protein SF052_07090 [Bacteroidia bacterium]|nr:hypothetical protein [Bacteroidia bacterium]
MYKLSVFVVAFFPALFFAQDNQVALTLRGDYESSQLSGFELNDFFQSYNEYYGVNMQQPFDTVAVKGLSHAGWGMGMRFLSGDNAGFATGIFLTYGSKSLRNEAIFANDLLTRTDFRVKDYNCQVDIGFHLKRFLLIQGHISARIRESVFDLGYVYQDGSFSRGNEYDILGVYKGSTITLDVGASAGLKLGPVFIPVGISFPTNMIPDDGLSTLLDYDITRIRWNDLPRNYQVWADDPVNFDPFEDAVRTQSFRSVRINIGLEIWLGKKSSEE